MSNVYDTQKYQTSSLPQYVIKHFGGWPNKIKMEKLKDDVWKFSGGGTEIVVTGKTAADARQRLKETIQHIDSGVAQDRRVVPKPPALN